MSRPKCYVQFFFDCEGNCDDCAHEPSNCSADKDCTDSEKVAALLAALEEFGVDVSSIQLPMEDEHGKN